MLDWLRLAARHWFLLPPLTLLLAVSFLLFAAFQEPVPSPGPPRPVRPWSEPIREYHRDPIRMSAQDTKDGSTIPVTPDMPETPDPATPPLDADEER
jgi:hypothetical protein